MFNVSKTFKLSLFTICMSSVHLKNTSSGEEQINIQNFIKEKNCTVKCKTIQTRLFLVELLGTYYLKSF